jgi:hypothetical protein
MHASVSGVKARRVWVGKHEPSSVAKGLKNKRVRPLAPLNGSWTIRFGAA